MPARRRPRGHIESLPSGSFRAVVYVGIDPLTGRARQIKETHTTRAEALKALTRLQHQVDERQHPKSAITVAEAIDQWLEVAKLEATTRERYEDLIRLYILPTIGKLQAGRLDAELLERLYARLQRCKHLCGARPPKGHVCRPLSTSTTRKVHYIIRGALECAVRWKYLGVNVAAMAEAPAPRKTKPDPPSAAEAAALLNDAWSDPEWGLLVWLTMVLGTRRGELCALRWRHIDFDRGTIWVERSTTHTRAGIGEKDTKTERERRLAVDPHTMELLRTHRERVEERCYEVHERFSDDRFLFSGSPDHSTPLHPRSVSQRYRRMATRLGLRSTRLHALRHYSATELIAAGVDVRTVAGRLGHGSAATTLKVYAAWVAEADQKAATTMAEILPKPKPLPRRPRGPYESIAQALRDDIRAGRLRPGDQLPTIVQLAAEYTVAAGTAHRAVAALANEGLIEVTRGKRARVIRARAVESGVLS